MLSQKELVQGDVLIWILEGSGHEYELGSAGGRWRGEESALRVVVPWW